METMDVWGLDEQVIKKSGKRFTMKHGMFAGVPILCKDNACPYKEVCTVEPSDRVFGARCPMEASAIIVRFEQWCKHFNINIEGNHIKDSDLADVSLIKDLVENEVQTLRAENRIAMNADFLSLTISQIDHKGKVYKELTLSPESEYKLSLQEKRYKILQLLNATRKDKIKSLNDIKNQDGVNSIFVRVKEKIKTDIEEINFDEEV